MISYYNYHWQKNNSRYYKIIVCKDMFSHWVLTCIWGAINSRLGNHKHIMLNNLDEAKTIIEAMMVRRIKRGYVLINARQGG